VTDDPADVPARPDPRPDPRPRRPWVERIGLAAIAAVLAIMFGGVAAASWIGGEPFLAVMGGIGCLMTAWVGALTLLRG
jgi:hypothetical protein